MYALQRSSSRLRGRHGKGCFCAECHRDEQPGSNFKKEFVDSTKTYFYPDEQRKRFQSEQRWWITGRFVDNDGKADVRQAGDMQWMMLNKNPHEKKSLEQTLGNKIATPAGKIRKGGPVLADEWSPYSAKIQKMQGKIRRRREKAEAKHAALAQMQLQAQARPHTSPVNQTRSSRQIVHKQSGWG